MPLIEVIRAQPPELGRCTAKECRRLVEWVVTVKNQKRMPVEHPLLVERVFDREGKAPITVIDSQQSHFATCPASARFSRRRRKTDDLLR